MEPIDPVIKALHILLAKVHLWQVGEGTLTVTEFELLNDICNWYVTEGKQIVEARHLTTLEIRLDY